MHYLVLNGRAQPYRGDAPAKLTFQIRGVYATEKEGLFQRQAAGNGRGPKTPDKAV